MRPGRSSVSRARTPAPSRSASPARMAASRPDRKSTRLNSSHDQISYAVFCLKKKKMSKIHLHTGAQPRATYGPADSESRDYIARQHFAKGEAAQLRLYGQKESDPALETYQRPIDI